MPQHDPCDEIAPEGDFWPFVAEKGDARVLPDTVMSMNGDSRRVSFPPSMHPQR